MRANATAGAAGDIAAGIVGDAGAAGDVASEAPLTVLKFGSSVLAREQDVPRAVHEIYRFYRHGHRVLAVVSALAGTTERLLAEARQFGDDLAPRGVAALLATGEVTAAALLLLALDRAGIPAALLDPRQARLRAAGPLLDAEPCGLDAALVRRRLERRRVVVMPGFFGEAEDGGVALLGRGGSDLTALYVAKRLGAAQCRLLKDVDGIYDSDPAAERGRAGAPRRFRSLGWQQAAGLPGGVVQPKALAFAARERVRFAVAALESDTATRVGGAAAAALDSAPPRVRRLRVLLLGLGTVGGGVYRHLLAEGDRFEVVGIAVRDPARHAAAGVPEALLDGDPWRLLERRPCDVVVEMLPGADPAARLIAAAAAGGRHVVTANKQVMAEEGEWLARHAAAHGAELRFSAAVGGAVPVLEAVARAAAEGDVTAVRGALNGTCNFVLDRMAAGESREAAVRLAQLRGFAEADPSRDLDGRDAACKLRLLARAAWGAQVPTSAGTAGMGGAGGVVRRGIEEIEPTAVAAARERGQVLRLIAECRRDGAGVHAEVRPALLPARHFLAGARGEENRVIVERRGAPALFLAGRGAGRWPTSEAVLADLFDLARRVALPGEVRP
jgi:homoserine dehydrogenase